MIGSTYDAHGNRTSVTHPDGTTFAYAYDGLDRLDYIADPTGQWIANPIYNDKGQLGSIYRNGNAIDTVFKYDTVGRLNSLRFLDVVSSSQVRWDYTRNPASQIITETRDNDAYAWLVENSFERDYTTNGLNQYEAAGSASFCYDANGNLTSDGAYVYLYDFENRLVQMRLAVNADCAALDYSGAWRATFNYDTMGRLRIVNEGPNSTRFVHDGEALIVEYDGSDTLLRRYVHGTNAEADDPLVWYEGAGTARADRRYLHADPRGSIVLTADADGNTIAINAYDEYGIPTTSNNGFDITTRGRFRYTGQVWLPELGMYYYKARIYSPTLGRFMQTDPIGYEDQFNLYAYVANDPINAVDPTGMDCEGTASCSPAMYPRQPEYTVNCGTYGNCSMEQQTRARAQVRTVPLDDPSVRQTGEAMVQLGSILISLPVGGRGGGFVAGLTQTARYAATARALIRTAEYAKPVASGIIAAGRRQVAATNLLRGLANGTAKIRAFATGGTHKGAFRGAGAYAKQHGGRSTDYSKIATSTVTKSGDRVSIHAVRNDVTGRIYDPKVIFGR